jgi:hypothetical protein
MDYVGNKWPEHTPSDRIYLVIEEHSDTATVISAHRSNQGADAAIKDLRNTWHNSHFWIDTIKLKD